MAKMSVLAECADVIEAANENMLPFQQVRLSPSELCMDPAKCVLYCAARIREAESGIEKRKALLSVVCERRRQLRVLSAWWNVIRVAPETSRRPHLRIEKG